MSSHQQGSLTHSLRSNSCYWQNICGFAFLSLYWPAQHCFAVGLIMYNLAQLPVTAREDLLRWLYISFSIPDATIQNIPCCAIAVSILTMQAYGELFNHIAA